MRRPCGRPGSPPAPHEAAIDRDAQQLLLQDHRRLVQPARHSDRVPGRLVLGGIEHRAARRLVEADPAAADADDGRRQDGDPARPETIHGHGGAARQQQRRPGHQRQQHGPQEEGEVEQDGSGEGQVLLRGRTMLQRYFTYSAASSIVVPRQAHQSRFICAGTTGCRMNWMCGMRRRNSSSARQR